MQNLNDLEEDREYHIVVMGKDDCRIDFKIRGTDTVHKSGDEKSFHPEQVIELLGAEAAVAK